MFKKIFLLFLIAKITPGQSLTGMSGMLSVPDGDLLKDGTVAFGVSYFEKEYLPDVFENDAIAYYATIGYLPFFEFGMRFTKNLAPGDALGDRMFSVKVKVLRETEYLPSIVLGVHDFVRSTGNLTNRFNTSYIVIGKKFSLTDADDFFLECNAGYGGKIFDASFYQFTGMFGGVSLNAVLNSFLSSELYLENDSKNFNGGVGLTLFDHFSILMGLMDFKYLSGGTSLRIYL